jgi:hydroxyethylthiazole kinase-like sugar kinase family protein
MGIASERAEEKGAGSGTLPALLIDELHRLNPEDFLTASRSGEARWREA